MLLNMAVFGAALSYVLMMVSHIVLRRREPDMHRPVPDPRRRRHHRIRPGASRCSRSSRPSWSTPPPRCGAWACFAAFMAYFGLYSRHHLVANSPDEEFAALAAAEDDLK